MKALRPFRVDTTQWTSPLRRPSSLPRRVSALLSHGSFSQTYGETKRGCDTMKRVKEGGMTESLLSHKRIKRKNVTNFEFALGRTLPINLFVRLTGHNSVGFSGDL